MGAEALAQPPEMVRAVNAQWACVIEHLHCRSLLVGGRGWETSAALLFRTSTVRTTVPCDAALGLGIRTEIKRNGSDVYEGHFTKRYKSVVIIGGGDIS